MIKRFFAKLGSLWRKIPLQLRVVINLLVIAAILALPMYILYYELLFTK